MRFSSLGIGGAKCRFMNINAANADVHLKSWSSIQIKRRGLHALSAGIRIPAGLCPLFAADPPRTVVWEWARHPPVPLLAALPEGFSSFTAVSCTNMR